MNHGTHAPTNDEDDKVSRWAANPQGFCSVQVMHNEHRR